MTQLHHDDSTPHLRRGFKAAAVAVALTAVLLAVQDWLPGSRAVLSTPAAMAPGAKAALPRAVGPAPLAGH